MPTETETATATTTPDFPTAEATVELTPPVEVTLEVTAELTAEATAEATDTLTETPTLTPTASETPLPPEPAWVLVSSADFEQGTPPREWRFGPGWEPQFMDGSTVFGPRTFGGHALLATPPLLDSAVQMRVRLQNGIFAFGLRQSEMGGYTVTFEEPGYLRLYRGRDELGQAFLGPIAGQWRTLRLSAAGDVVRVSLDGAELITFVDTAPPSAGVVTIGGRRSLGSRFQIDDVTVWAAEGEWTPPPASAAFAAPMDAQSDDFTGRISTSLAYGITLNGSYDQLALVVISPDGTTRTFNDMRLAGSNAWSPDGQWVLVRATGNAGISKFNPTTQALVALTTVPPNDVGIGDDCPSWSPDGSQIVFRAAGHDGFATDAYGDTYPQYAIYVMPADNPSSLRGLMVQSSGILVGCPQWVVTQDGPRVMVDTTDWDSYTTDLMVIDVETGASQVVYHTQDWVDWVTASPDGRRVALLALTDCGCLQRVRVIDVACGPVIDVTEPNVYYSQYSPFAWNQNGTRLVLSRFGELTLADLLQNSLTEIPNSDNSYNYFWSPDEQWIASAVWDGYLRLLKVDGSETLRIPAELYISYDTGDMAWQPLPADPNAPLAFSSGSDYCLPVVTPTPTPQPTVEPCMGFPVDDTANIRRQPSITADLIPGEVVREEGRPLLARLSIGTSGLWDDWYLVLVVKDDGETELGWSRVDVVYTSPRYGDACKLPISDQEEVLLDPEQRQLLELWGPTLEGHVGDADPLFEQSIHEELRLPAPFDVMPADDRATRISNQGYGLNRFAFLNSDFYDGTNHIHSGLDFSSTEAVDSIGQECAAGDAVYPNGECFRIRAVCDGLVYAVSDPLSTGTGRRLSLRCTAPDGSLSNLYVVYNHLRDRVSDTEFSGGEWVSAGDILGGLRVFPYVTTTGVTPPHLHLEVFYHRGPDFSPETSSTIRLNPLLFFSHMLVQLISDSKMGYYYPTGSYTDTGEEKRYEWDDYDTDDPGDIYALRLAYVRNDPESPEDYDLGIDPVHNGTFACLGDTFPPVSDPINVWFREEHYPGIQHLGSVPQPETPGQVIRSWSDLVIRLQQGQ